MFIPNILITLYIFFAMVRRLSTAWYWKAVLTLILVVGAFKFQIYALCGTSWATAPAWFPVPLVYFLLWLNALTIAVFALLVPFDIARWCFLLGMRLCKRPLPAWYPPVISWGHAVILILASMLSSLAFWNGVYARPVVREISLPIRNLPPEAVGMRLAVLSDLHVDDFFPACHTEQIIETTNDLNPDVILITGDFVDGRPETRAKLLAPLARLAAKEGVLGCAGNHEYYCGYRELQVIFKNIGIRMLDNEHELIRGVAFAGVTDNKARQNDMEGANIGKAVAGIPQGTPVICLAHTPQLAPYISTQPVVQVQFSGHTHGGMLPGLAWLVGRFNGGFSRGDYTVNGLKLFIGNGTGIWNGFPFRLNCPAEILCVTLIGAD